MSQEEQRHHRIQEHDKTRQMEVGVSQTATQAGVRHSAEQTARTKRNPQFLREAQDPDIDSEKYEWVRNELGVPMAGGHMFGSRDEGYERERNLLNMANSEILLTERSPGKLLREDDRRLAAVQRRVESPDDADMRRTPTQEERRAVRDGFDLVSSRQSLAVDGRFLDALTSIQTETSVRNDKESESATGSRISKLFS